MPDIPNLSTIGSLARPGAFSSNWHNTPATGLQKHDPLLYRELCGRHSTYPFTLNPHAEVSPMQALHRQAMKGDLESMYKLAEHYQTGNELPDEDHYLAYRLIRYAAKQGYKPAFAALGNCYAYGVGTQQNPEEAAQWFLKIDYSTDVNILGFMALCYHLGVGVPKDEPKAYDLWIDAAEKGHPDGFRYCQAAAEAGYARGQEALGFFYQQGLGIPADINEAVRSYHQAAAQGYAPAQCRLGILCSEGEHGIEKEPEAAVQWFQRAAAQNDPVAKHWLAYCLANGDGIEQNKEEAAQIWRELSQPCPDYPKGNPASQYSLGALLLDKEYRGYAPHEGIKFLRKSAEQNYLTAQRTLGIFYYNGFDDVIQQNYEQARQWFRKAAKQGEHIAACYLGDIYSDGNGVPVHHKKAFQYYKQSSEKGCMSAMQKLAHLYLEGIGTKKDEPEGYYLLALLAQNGDDESLTLLRSAALSGNPAAGYGMWTYHRANNELEAGYEWLEKSADNGNADALCRMAVRYEREGETEQSRRYYRLAAEKGHPYAQAMLGLSLETFTDKKAPQNEEAFKWIQKAANQKYPQAVYYLGNLYRTGIWVDADADKALECYIQAAEMDVVEAFKRLGECYASGTGVAPDDTIAFQYFRQAAEKGSRQAQTHFALFLLSGRGCQQDTELAFRWLTQAASAGDPNVFQILEYAGLDVGKLIDGYKLSRQVAATATGERFVGENFDKIFQDTVRSVISMLPKEEGQG